MAASSLSPTSLGKRKQTDELSSHGATLFVSNLPYNSTSVDLETLFSDIAPVRSAFVVLEQGTGISKGVGYVAFAIKEDALVAYENISRDGIDLNGRKLRVQWPDANRSREVADATTTSLPAAAKSRPQPKPRITRLAQDKDAIRTIIISGLPPNLTAAMLWKKIRKYPGAEKVEWPMKFESGTEDPSIAHVLFHNSTLAQDAVVKLHAHVYKSCLLSVTLKKRLDALTVSSSNSAETTNTKLVQSPNRSSRLIIRNLPFNITSQDLRAIFLPYGPIHAIDIPLSDEGKGRGFAFVWMLSRKDAEQALERTNGNSIRPGLAEALIGDKQKRKKARREEKKRLMGHEEAEEVEAENHEAAGSSVKERTIAVDWALSKGKWEEEQAKTMEESEDEADDDIPVSSEGTGSENSLSSDEEEFPREENFNVSSDNIGVHEGETDEDARSEGDIPTRPQLPPPETGTTLFVRNVPFSATEDDLRSLFAAYGPLRYARITLDPSTGRPRGTGFVCFWNVADADKIVEQSALLRSEMTGTAAPLSKKNPFSLPSILTPDPSSKSAASLVLHGRTLDVVTAVTRGDANKLKEAGERSREKADKRNIYLLREGVIMPNTPASATLTPKDVERRTNSYNARRSLLKTNPSLYISKTRLSIRQIPTFVTERLLKRLAIHAMRSFEVDVKKKRRPALTDIELAETEVDADQEETGRKKRIAGKLDRRTGVKQAKIVRQHERVDPVTGKGKSKGYGFLELLAHADALRVLRWSNNNPEVGKLFEQWWTEELKDLIEAEEKKEKKEQDEARLKRMKLELEHSSIGKAKGTSLIAEFSIENAQVVGRRIALQNRPPASKPIVTREKIAFTNKVEDDQRPEKRRRLSDKEPTINEAQPAPSQLGFMIGRKRKAKKSGSR